MVLDLLAQEKSGLGSYASVCNEWADVLERKVFGRLRLGVSCLDDFEQMVSRRKGLVRHIWLHVELQPYTCQGCECKGTVSEMRRNQSTFRRAMSKLFAVLATWPAGDGLTLELSVRSPSDEKHWFKNWKWDFGTEAVDDEPQERLHDPRHGWVDGRRVAVPSSYAVDRIYEDVWVDHGIPAIDAVTKLVIRRQCRRTFSTWLEQLLEALPRLEYMFYEPWRQWQKFEPSESWCNLGK